MKLQMLFIIFLLAAIQELCGQSSIQKMCQRVLVQAEIGKPYSFDKSTKANGHDETILIYLGSAELKNGRIFKIITYEYVWGPNLHSSGSIYIFNGKNQYVGQYHLGSAIDLPTKLRESNLIFTNSDNESCDKKLVTTVTLGNGLPKILFIKCRGVYGDIYSFTSSD